MSITIPGVPEYLTREQYTDLFKAAGFDPSSIQELRFAADGVHALVFARNEHGRKFLDHAKPHSAGYVKHRVFIPVRNTTDDARTTRVTPVNN